MLLAKKCFVIKGSPRPVADCRNHLNGKGDLTVGFGTNPVRAWWTVLKVLGLRADGQPLRAAPIQVATGESSSESECQESMPKRARAAGYRTEEQRVAALGIIGDEAQVRAANLARLRGIWLCGHGCAGAAISLGNFRGIRGNRGPLEFVFTGNFYCSCERSKVRRMRQAQRNNREAAELLGFDLREATLELQPDVQLHSRSRWCHRALMYLSVSFYLRMVVAQWKENAFASLAERQIAEE